MQTKRFNTTTTTTTTTTTPAAAAAAAAAAATTFFFFSRDINQHCFQHSKIKLFSPRRRVIFSICY